MNTVIADAGLPDPTRPADYSEARAIVKSVPKKRAEFSVNAIRISDSDRSAIVNGRLVRIGDEVGQAQVIEINAVNVVLNFERKLMTVPLYAASFNKKYKTLGDEK